MSRKPVSLIQAQWLKDLFRQVSILTAPDLAFVKSFRIWSTHEEETAKPAQKDSSVAWHIKVHFLVCWTPTTPREDTGVTEGYFPENPQDKKWFMLQHCSMHNQATSKQARLCLMHFDSHTDVLVKK